MPDGADLTVQVVHASPGRLRLRLPRDAFASPELAKLETVVSGQPGIRDVRRNERASSVTITYDPQAVSLPELAAAAAGTGVSVTMPAPPAWAGSVDGRVLGRSIERVFGRADGKVTEASRGMADLRTLVPVGFAALAAREVLAGRAVAAPWYVLAWYAFETFTKLRRPDQPAVPSRQ